MPEAVKVYTTDTFIPLAQDIKRFGTMFKHEALTGHGSDLVAAAMRRRVCAERATRLGPLLYLLHQGRKLTALAGAFVPTDDSLMDAACLRQAALLLEEGGHVLDLTTRKRSIFYQQGRQKILVLAQHDGYAFAALRRLYKAWVDTDQVAEIHLYCYLMTEELEKLAQLMYEPRRGSRAHDRQRLQLFRLEPLV